MRFSRTDSSERPEPDRRRPKRVQTPMTFSCSAFFGSVLAVTAHAALAGTWTNVTPAAIDLDAASFNHDNFGVQDVLVDPARPSHLYAFTCFQGVWKSADYGVNWVKINSG